MFKTFLLGLGVTLIALIIFMGTIKIRSLDDSDKGQTLAIRWEGLYHDYNFRDVGQSLNECLEKTVFQTNLLTRSAGWFSGWSCDSIGNPDIIFSLNYSPKKAERFFCQSEKGKYIGRFSNTDIKLSDLEFLGTWDNEQMREPACRFVADILQAVVLEKKTLVHCDAGRDRTGAISALVVALAAEEKGLLTPRMLDAIECDYRKTESLDKEKHGRMKRFIEHLQAKGGINQYLQTKCRLDRHLISKAADKLVLSSHL